MIFMPELLKFIFSMTLRSELLKFIFSMTLGSELLKFIFSLIDWKHSPDFYILNDRLEAFSRFYNSLEL